MQKVITINLNGNAYQLEETAYGLLRAYLDRAEQQLKDNPDKAEIISDLEQAIADKCNRVLGAQKTVVTTAEVQKIIEEMGPVEGGEPSSEKKEERSRTDAGAPKRLYQIRDGAMLSGVCKGLAAYFNIDVTIVRIIFVVLAVLTKGAFIIAYIVLMCVIPHATTSEERAAAHGQPFNAQELIDGAKRNYANFKGSRNWKRQWRRRQREWRRHTRPMAGGWWGAPPPTAAAGYAGQIVAGIMMPVLTVVRAVVFWIWLCVLASLLSTNALFGWPIPDGVPLWAAVAVAAVTYTAVAWPLHEARRASYYAIGAHNYGWIAAWDGLLGFAVSVVCLWLAYQYVPEVHDLADHLPVVRDNLQNFLSEVGIGR